MHRADFIAQSDERVEVGAVVETGVAIDGRAKASDDHFARHRVAVADRRDQGRLAVGGRHRQHRTIQLMVPIKGQHRRARSPFAPSERRNHSRADVADCGGQLRPRRGIVIGGGVRAPRAVGGVRLIGGRRRRLREGLMRGGLLRGVLMRGVLMRGVLMRGVLMRGVLMRGVLMRESGRQ